MNDRRPPSTSEASAPKIDPGHEQRAAAQAGALYRVLSEDARARLIDNLSESLAEVTKQHIVDTCLEHFANADADYGRRLAAAVRKRRAVTAV